MDELLHTLEARIKSLTHHCQNLKKTNEKLMHNSAILSRQKEILIQRHKIAIGQIESMVSRLKSLEKSD